jgi:hypothetical protein
MKRPLNPVGDGGGRGPNGRFLPGNKLAKGNPLARRVQVLRSAALGAVTPRDLAGVIRKLVRLALDGDVAAAREVLQRCLGPADAIDLAERIDKLESVLSDREL